MGRTFAAFFLPLMAGTAMALLGHGISVGELDLPLRRVNVTVRWDENPTGFVLLAFLYAFLAALLAFLALFMWRARRNGD